MPLLIVLAGLPAADPLAAPRPGPGQAGEGAPAWSTDLGTIRGGTLLGHAVVSGQLLVEDSGHGVTALDPDTGLTRWFLRLPGALDHWPAAGPALVFACGADLVVAEPATGRRIAHITAPAVSAGSPVSDGRIVIIPALLGNRLVAVDLRTGLTAWEFVLGAPLGGPALLAGDGARSTAVVACEDGTLHAVPVQLEPPTTERWSTRVGALAGPPVVSGRRLIVALADSAVLALDAATGAVLWRHLPGERPTGAAVTNGELVFVGTTGHIAALAIATGEVLWQRARAERPLAADGDHLLVARGTTAVLLDPSDGRQVAGGLPPDTTLAGGLLVARRPPGRIVALPATRSPVGGATSAQR